MPDLSIDALLALMRTRRSIRNFSPAPLPLGTEQKLLEAAVWAPSGGNAQPWHFVLVRDADAKKQLCFAAHAQRFVASAPLVIVVCADRERAHKALEIARALLSGESLQIQVEGERLEILPEEVEVRASARAGLAVAGAIGAGLAVVALPIAAERSRRAAAAATAGRATSASAGPAAATRAS